jgi:hypothetical protein
LKRNLHYCRQQKAGIAAITLRTSMPEEKVPQSSTPWNPDKVWWSGGAMPSDISISKVMEAKRELFEAKIVAAQARMTVRSEAAFVAVTARSAAFNARADVALGHATPRTSAKSRMRKKAAAEAAERASKAVHAAARRIIAENRRAAEEALSVQAETAAREEEAKRARVQAIQEQRYNIQAHREAEEKKRKEREEKQQKKAETHDDFIQRIRASWPKKPPPQLLNWTAGGTRADAAKEEMEKKKALRDSLIETKDEDSAARATVVTKKEIGGVSKSAQLTELAAKREAHRSAFLSAAVEVE